MAHNPTLPLIAVDVGNSRFKLGLFRELQPAGLPEPSQILQLDVLTWQPAEIANWLHSHGLGAASWRISSVNHAASDPLAEWIRSTRREDLVRSLAAADLPLQIELAEPERAGIDRLLAAVGVNCVRDPGAPAVVVDFGSAITVDLVRGDGAFCGGAIMPGVAMSARALNDQTESLPYVEMRFATEAPSPLGRSTLEAIQGGLFWGALGGVRELVGRLAAEFDRPPQLFLTGGTASVMARFLGNETRCLPHLILAGIAVTQREAPA